MPNKESPTVIDLSNPALWVPVYLPLLTMAKRRKLLYGSRDSAKSHFVAQAIIVRMLSEKFKGLLVRKTYTSIKESQWQTIKEIIEGYGWAELFEFRVAPLQIICKLTGARLIALGMDNAGKAKSVKDVSLVWYEEFDELELGDFTQTTLSIRGKNIEEWFTWNSTPTDHWILGRFFPMSEDGEPDLSYEQPDGMFVNVNSTDPEAVIFHTCYKHNPHCNDVRRKEYDWMAAHMPEEYRTSGLGLMGRRNLGSLWMRSFNRSKHIRKLEVRADLPIHLTFDQNNLPYSTMIAYQFVPLEDNIIEIRAVREFCYKPPKNSTEHLCNGFIYEFGELDPEVYIYGDTTGRNETQRKEIKELAHHYDAVKKFLADYMHNRSMKVAASAPSIKGRQRFMTVLLEEGTFLRYVVDPSCKELIADFEYLVEDENGGYVKKRVKDKETGQSWEEHGHCFVGSTMITTDVGQVQIADIHPGDRVLTRAGYRNVLKRFDNGTRPVHRFNISGIEIECTKDHRLFTNNRGFVEISTLKEGDELLILEPWLPLTTGEHSGHAQSPRTQATGATSEATSTLTEKSQKPICTGTNGKQSMARSLKGATFTTKTETRTTTISRIWSASMGRTTVPCMRMRTGTTLSSRLRCNPILKIFERLRNLGTGPKKGRLGTKNTLELLQANNTLRCSTACIARASIWGSKKPKPTSVPTCVGGSTGTMIARQSGGYVSSVPRHSRFVRLSQSDIAQLNAAMLHGEESPVHDLHIEGEHEYFANGILVHNCMDSTINLLYQAFKDIYRKVAKV